MRSESYYSFKEIYEEKKKHCDFIFLDSVEYLNCFVHELRQGEGFMWEFEAEANEKEVNKEYKNELINSLFENNKMKVII